MKIVIFVFALICIMLGVTTVGMQSIDYTHTLNQMSHAYHKALHASMYSADESKFEQVFNKLAPDTLNYSIKLLGSHEYPRLRRYAVEGVGKYYTLRFDETMIEERSYE